MKNGSCTTCKAGTVPVVVGDVKQGTARIHFLLLLDRSGSMGGDSEPNTKWRQLKRSASSFMNKIKSDKKMREAIRVSAVAYDEVSDIAFETQLPSTELIDELKFIGGGTNYRKAMNDALDILVRT